MNGNDFLSSTWFYTGVSSLRFSGSVLPARSAASSAIPSSMVREWCIEQNFGPHIPQNSALLKYSAGRVSS